ncbi:MAG: putative Transposon Ty3-I Gag-Pol polyprotein [Streblomastix strix]|uniref:Putative Transposon Ty3-I Gag-Pol polyprotein n=1 Tax=Streblomastix strix TaxID=222440 RepID=A0A5J4W4Y1_9EUKA|nr:MAG: putative Transposon Ty3-I Gag-Pol polyprotein [Streblomastix strix]
MRAKRSIVPDRAGTFQPREIGDDTSLWNRGEERADVDGSSRDQQRLEENKMIIPFRGTQEEKKAYQEKLKEELEEGIIIPIQQDQVKWWNHTFLKKKPNGTQRKILDASKLNKEIEKLYFKMHGLEDVQYLANQMEQSTSLDLKSAFHHITVSPNSISYLAFNFNNNNYAYKAMPFGIKHSPIFFAEAIESIFRQIKIHSEIKIMNCYNGILLIHQDRQILKTQTIEIMKTLEQFEWTISQDKCETEPKLIITFLGWIWNLKEMNIKMSEERKSKMIQALNDWCNTIYKSMNVKIRQLAALIGRLNFLRPQIKEASLYLIELDKAKTLALKTESLDGIMIVNKVIIKELKWWIRRIGDNQPESLINKTITCTLTTDAYPQGWGATLIYENQIELIQHDCWNKKEVEMTSNAKEIKAIYYGLLRFEQVFKKMQDQVILIRSDNTTAVYDIGKWKAKEFLIERIKQVFYLMKRLKLQITTIHIPGKLNSTTDSISRLCRSGDYTLKDRIIQTICKTWNYMLEIDIFATQYNKLINNYATVDLNDLGTYFHNAIKQTIMKNEVGQSTGNSNSTDLAGTIVVLQTKEFIHQIHFPWISRQDSGDGIENERQGSKTSSRQCGRLPSGPVADVGRDLLKRYLKVRGFSEDGVNLLFKGQRFNTVKRDFYSLALLQDWLDIERITIEEMMKKDAEVILIEVIAFHTRQNNSVASAKSHKACLTIKQSLIYKKNLASSTSSKQINKAPANSSIPHRRYQNI